MKYTGDDRFDDREALAHAEGVHTWCPRSCPDGPAWDAANADLDRKREALYAWWRTREDGSSPPDDPRDVLLTELAAFMGVTYRPGDARSVAALRLRARRQATDRAVSLLASLVPSDLGPDGSAFYRVGNEDNRDIYLVVDDYEVHVGNMFDPADGPYVVEALNRFVEQEGRTRDE